MATKTKTKTDKLQARVDSLELELLQVLKHQPEVAIILADTERERDDLLKMLRYCELFAEKGIENATTVEDYGDLLQGLVTQIQAAIACATKKN